MDKDKDIEEQKKKQEKGLGQKQPAAQEENDKDKADQTNQENDSQIKDKLIAIIGPTGSGKSDLALFLAKKLNGEVISGDSMQVYRGLDIGSAKIKPEERENIEHYLIDIQDYTEPFHVKLFQQKAREAIETILAKGKLPILCGGTGLYIKAALYDYTFPEEEKDEAYEAYLQTLQTPILYSMLESQDPGSLEKIHPNNRKRILRALMAAHDSMPKSKREAMQKHEPLFDIFFLGLSMDKDELDIKIEQRVEKMMEMGLLEEVESLFKDPKTWSYSSFQGIGYKEFREYFQGRQSLQEVIEWIVIHTRQYAKRQMSWFRNQVPVHWFKVEDRSAMLEAIETWLNRGGSDTSLDSINNSKGSSSLPKSGQK